MATRRFLIIGALTVSSLLVASASVQATTRVSGTLKGGAGFTVLGVPASGTGPAVKVKRNGRFTVTFRGSTGRNATLQVVGRTGTYFGPVTLGRAGKSALIHLSGRSGNLGTLVRRSGYVVPRTPVRNALVNRGKRTRANAAGKPVGAGRLGYGGNATKKGSRALAHGWAGAHQAPAPGPGGPPNDAMQLGADADADGLPTAIDVDANGNGVLDTNDPAMPPVHNRLGWTFTSMRTSYPASINVNAGGITDADINSFVEREMAVTFMFAPSKVTPALAPTSVDVDCGALAWCRPADGTAEVFATNNSTGAPPIGSKWAAYDPDGTGLPNLTAPGTNAEPGGPTWKMAVRPRVSRASLTPADTMTFIGRTPTGNATLATTLGPYFITTPAIASIGHGGTTTAVQYPGTASSPGSSDANPITLTGDGTATITFWRPQRAGIPGAEADALIDMGGLSYLIYPPSGTMTPGGCTEVTPLSPGVTTSDQGSFRYIVDGAADAPPNAASTITVAVDLKGCLTRAGTPPERWCGKLSLVTELRNAAMASQDIWVRMPGLPAGAQCRMGM